MVLSGRDARDIINAFRVLRNILRRLAPNFIVVGTKTKLFVKGIKEILYERNGNSDAEVYPLFIILGFYVMS